MNALLNLCIPQTHFEVTPRAELYLIAPSSADVRTMSPAFSSSGFQAARTSITGFPEGQILSQQENAGMGFAGKMTVTPGRQATLCRERAPAGSVGSFTACGLPHAARARSGSLLSRYASVMSAT